MSFPIGNENGVYNGGQLYVYPNVGWEEPFILDKGEWEVLLFGVKYRVDDNHTTVLPWHGVSRIDILYEN